MKKISIKKKQIQIKLRLAIITILSIIVIISAYTTFAAFQQPITTEKNIITCEYSHNGKFDYTVHLKNNTIYDNTSILQPGQEIIFRKLTESIKASFTYQFHCDQTADIQGYCTVLAQLNTDLWSKEYTLIPKTSFSSNGNIASFNASFPINYTRFESIVNQIDAETGVSAGDLKLIINCDVILSAETSTGNIYEPFSSSLSVPLRESIIQINGDLLQYKSGVLEETEEVFEPGVIEQRNIWGLASIILFIILIVFLAFTRSGFVSISKTEKMVKKIRKKYDEWIVETEKRPMVKGAEVIPMKSLEDLVKISEELGKPVIYYKSPPDLEEKHTFYVLDETVHYEYVLTDNEKIKKTTRCPKCNTKVSYEEYPWENIYVTCPNCGSKGIVAPKNITKTIKKVLDDKTKK